MKAVRIFIGSPGDVHEERDKARRVVNTLKREFEDRLDPRLVAWEDMPLSATESFQIGIEAKLDAEEQIDIAVFVFWWKLGSPLEETLTRADGTPYRSGTEHEFDFILHLVEENRRNGKEGPEVLVYFRHDDTGLAREFSRVGQEKWEEMVQQQKLLRSFYEENFQDRRGGNTRSHYDYEQPVDFAELLFKHLHALLDQLDLGGSRTVWQEAPYRGLSVFDVQHAPIFRGREQEIFDVHQRLRQRAADGCAFVCIVGASGSGKSSLARAGVAAKLIYRSFDETVKEWRLALLYPAAKQNLLAALVDGLIAAPDSDDSSLRLPDPLPTLAVEPRREKLLRYLEDGNAEAARELLERVFEAEEANLKGKVSVLLVVDQMEELWSDKRLQPEPFLKAVECLAKLPGFAVLATLRSDFYHLAQASPAFLRLKGDHGHFDLTRPGRNALREIIQKPARAAGIAFEQGSAGSLDERILRDSLRDPGALPLLQYALAELHRRCREEAPEEGPGGDGDVPRGSSGLLVLRHAVYDEIGGVEGAITQRATEVFASLSRETQEALPDLLPLLVSVEPGSEEDSPSVRLRPRLRDVTGGDEGSPRAELTRALVSARFLTTDHENGVATVTVAHEALLKRWQSIADWIRRNRDCLRIRSQIAQAHAHWKALGRDPSLLLPRGVALDEGRCLLEDASHLLIAEGYEALSDYIRRSIGNDFQRELAKTVPENLSRDLRRHHPGIWRTSLEQSLVAESKEQRRNTARLLRGGQAAEFEEQLIAVLTTDECEAVRQAAAQALVSIDADAPFDRIARQDAGSAAPRFGKQVRVALARLVAVSDMAEERPHFADWFARLPRRQASPIQRVSHLLRLRSAGPVFFFVLVCSILFSMFGAAAVKWLPSAFNYSCVQADASGFRGLFAASVAAFMIGGGTVFGLTLYRMVVGREYDRLSMLRPFAAVLYGGFFALVSGSACLLLIALVFAPESLVQMGWTTSETRLPLASLLHELYVVKRSGYAFPATCLGLGLGMALMTNGLRASTAWPQFLDRQSAVTSLGQGLRVARGIVKLSLPFAWPIVLLTPLFAFSALLVMQGAEPAAWQLSGDSAQTIFLGGLDSTWSSGQDGSPVDPVELRARIGEWKNSLEGRLLGLSGDVVSKIVGGYFAIVGMGLGIVMLRHGVRVDPRGSQR